MPKTEWFYRDGAMHEFTPGKHGSLTLHSGKKKKRSVLDPVPQVKSKAVSPMSRDAEAALGGPPRKYIAKNVNGRKIYDYED